VRVRRHERLRDPRERRVQADLGAFESVTIVCNYDGVQHKAAGLRGSVAIGLNAKGIPTWKYRCLGLYQTVADTLAVTPDYSAFKVPVVANSANTPVFYLHDVLPVVQSFDIDLANQPTFRALIGGESIQILDREPTGKIVFEATTVAFKDWWTVAKNATLDAFALIHGTARASGGPDRAERADQAAHLLGRPGRAHGERGPGAHPGLRSRATTSS
jgi:hypothetical protein